MKEKEKTREGEKKLLESAVIGGDGSTAPEPCVIL